MNSETQKLINEMDNKLKAAKIKMMQNTKITFVLSIFFHLKFRWDETIPTACTNGIYVRYNPKFAKQQSIEDFMFVLLHEAWHVALMHMSRRCNRDPKRYNYAGDYIINQFLKDGGLTVPEYALYDSQYKGMTTEEVYEALPDDYDETDNSIGEDIQEASEGNSGGSDGQPDYSDGMSPEQIKAKIEKTIIDSATKTQMMGKKAAGSIPAYIQRQIDNLINPKLPWQVILRNFFNGIAKNDYSWKRPNRRYMSRMYLPSLYSKGMGEVAVAVDTSGSVTEEELTQFLSEVNDIRRKLKPELTTVIDFDTEINNVTKLGRDTPISKVKFSGGGGTDLQPVFDYYDTHHPKVLIVFSDLWCEQITEKPKYPVIWISVNNPNAEVNFGQLIHMDTNT